MTGPSDLHYRDHPQAGHQVPLLCEVLPQRCLLVLVVDGVVVVQEAMPCFPARLTTVHLAIVQVLGDVDHTLGAAVQRLGDLDVLA